MKDILWQMWHIVFRNITVASVCMGSTQKLLSKENAINTQLSASVYTKQNMLFD